MLISLSIRNSKTIVGVVGLKGPMGDRSTWSSRFGFLVSILAVTLGAILCIMSILVADLTGFGSVLAPTPCAGLFR